MFGIPKLLSLALAAGGVALIVGGIWWDGHGSGYRKGVAAERATWQPVLRDFRTCKLNLADTRSALDRSQAAVDSITADGDERSQRAADAILQARKASESYRKERARIASAKPGDNECEAARNLIRSTLAARR